MNGTPAIGVDFGGTNIRAAIVDRDGRVSHKISKPTSRYRGNEAVVETLIEMIETLTKKTSGPIIGIGIGAPGPLNASEGIVYQMPNIEGFENFPLRDIVSRRLQLPVVLLNDADAAAVGEYNCGAAKGLPLFGLLTLGTGLGSSVLISGRPWTGLDGFSPEFGHIPIFGAGTRCGCGGIGHAETRISTAGLWEQYRISTGSVPSSDPLGDLSVRKLFEMCCGGDTIACDTINRYGDDLGRLIVTMAVVYNLHDVIIGGGISSGWELLATSVEQSIRLNGFSPLTVKVRIRTGLLGDDAAIIGAASMVQTDIERLSVE